MSNNLDTSFFSAVYVRQPEKPKSFFAALFGTKAQKPVTSASIYAPDLVPSGDINVDILQQELERSGFLNLSGEWDGPARLYLNTQKLRRVDYRCEQKEASFSLDKERPSFHLTLPLETLKQAMKEAGFSFQEEVVAFSYDKPSIIELTKLQKQNLG